MPDVALTDLKPHPRNYNVHSDAQIARLAESLRRFGQSKEIVTWRGLIIAGHGLVEAARKLGWPTLRANDMTARWSETEALAYMAADNELARLADPDEAALAALVAGLAGVDAQLAALAAGTAERMKELLASTQPPPADPGPQLDRAEELQAKWQTATGQLWELGAHRLVCGDCTDTAAVDRLMQDEKADAVLADPPYGANFDPTKDRGKLAPSISRPKIIGDEDTKIARKAWSFWQTWAALHIWWGANYYADALPPSSCWLVWDKENGANDFADVELAWCNQQRAARIFHHMWNGMLKDSERGERRLHGTQKPIELMIWCIEYLGDGIDIVADPFLGSGTTLIACERLGRRCRAIEIEPKYVAVALERWATMTGRTPILIDDPVQPESHLSPTVPAPAPLEPMP
jgi:DNA modification methylase